jgi:hypothetical protein
MLAANQASLAQMTSDDWMQTLLVDKVGIGVAAANARLATFTPAGRWVWALDDDDLCVHPGLVADVLALEAEHNPDLIVVRFDHGYLDVLPTPTYWRRPPECGRIGGSGVITRADLWLQCRDKWATGHYESDCDFVQAAYRTASNVIWHDVIAGMVQRISMGAVE